MSDSVSAMYGRSSHRCNISHNLETFVSRIRLALSSHCSARCLHPVLHPAPFPAHCCSPSSNLTRFPSSAKPSPSCLSSIRIRKVTVGGTDRTSSTQELSGTSVPMTQRHGMEGCVWRSGVTGTCAERLWAAAVPIRSPPSAPVSLNLDHHAPCWISRGHEDVLLNMPSLRAHNDMPACIWMSRPRSRGRLPTTRGGAGSDLHNLFPTDCSVNHDRANLFFRNIHSLKGATPFVDTTPAVGYDGYLEAYRMAGGWEPPDAAKGIVARACFYMACMYCQAGPDGRLPLRLVERESSRCCESCPSSPAAANSRALTAGAEPADGGHHVATGQMGQLSVLREWNRSFPPGTSEMARNEAVASIQGSRNPFIDLPELAEMVDFEWCCSQDPLCTCTSDEGMLGSPFGCGLS